MKILSSSRSSLILGGLGSLAVLVSGCGEDPISPASHVPEPAHAMVSMVESDTAAWMNDELVFEDEASNEIRLVRSGPDAEFVEIYINDEEAGGIALERQGGTVSTIRWVDPSGAWVRTTASSNPQYVDAGGWECPPELCPEPEFHSPNVGCEDLEAYGNSLNATDCDYFIYGALGAATVSIGFGIIGALTAQTGVGLVFLRASVAAAGTAIAGGAAYLWCKALEPE